jgi:hypothetical protein
VAIMVLNQAIWMSALGRSTGERPPSALWDAVVAEDWFTVRDQWDRWVWSELREMDESGKDWRSVVAVMVGATVEAVKSAGADGSFLTDLGEPHAVMREWGPWIAKRFTAVTDGARSHEWARYVEALPVELQVLAAEHPEQQAEVVACVFETDMVTRGLLDNDEEG